jgi:mono/diheme cytochrome c family protein
MTQQLCRSWALPPLALVTLIAAFAQSQDIIGHDGNFVWTKPATNQASPPLSLVRFLAEPNTGADLFQNHCTTCHDAARSLTKKKSLADWRITVRKMAEKPDADIPEQAREPVAQYLAVQAGVGGSTKPEGGNGSTTSGAPSVVSPKEKDEGKSKADNTALIQQGQAEFNARCTTCHDAEKSLQKTKSLSAWRATVERMAAKDGANIPESAHEAIATYLASLANKGKDEKEGAAAESGLPVSITGTLSAMYRGSGDPNLEDPGHFGDAWLGFAWQPKGPVSGQVTTCISCHSQGAQLGNSLELVEARLRLDVNKCL